MRASPSQQDFLNAEEACALLGVKRDTLYAYASRGRIKSYRQGMRRRRLYSRREVERLAGSVPGSRNAPRPGLPRAEDWVGYV